MGHRTDDDQKIVSGTVVAVNNRGLLIAGPSGAGKSDVAIRIIALGGTLIGDDQVVVRRQADRLVASPLPNTLGKIEARYLGILDVPHQQACELVAFLDMSQAETRRLPPERTDRLLGCDLPLYRGQNHASIANVMYLLLCGAQIHR